MSHPKLYIVQSEMAPLEEKLIKPKRKANTRKVSKFQKRSCLNKKRFHSHDHAKEFITGFRYGSSKNFGKNLSLRAYHCNFCNGWHTTSSIPDQLEVA